MSRPAKPAIEQSRRRGRTGSQRIPEEAIEDRRTLKKKVFEAKRKRDISTVEGSQPNSEESDKKRQADTHERACKPGRRCSRQGRARQSDIRNKQTTTKRSRYTRGSERPGCQQYSPRKRSEQPSPLSRTKNPLDRTISVQKCLKQIHS